MKKKKEKSAIRQNSYLCSLLFFKIFLFSLGAFNIFSLTFVFNSLNMGVYVLCI